MTAKIENIRVLRGMGIFADRDEQSLSLDFRKYNLIYGFNGSGKSTLSRLFSSLESGVLHEKLPEGGIFEIELDDGSKFGCLSRLSGLEKRLLVFNADYVKQNLSWDEGHANPVNLYIGADMASAAADLAKIEAQIDSQRSHLVSIEGAEAGAEKSFKDFKRNHAKIVAMQLHLMGRKYEAPQFSKDCDDWKEEDLGQLSDDELKAYEETAKLDQPMPEVVKLGLNTESFPNAYSEAAEVCGQSVASIALDEVQRFPDMLLWLKAGHEFHENQELEQCLFCGNQIPAERRVLLASALDGRIDDYLIQIETSIESIKRLVQTLKAIMPQVPDSDLLVIELRPEFKQARLLLATALREADELLNELLRVLSEKRQKPASPADVSSLASLLEFEGVSEKLAQALNATNAVLGQHNRTVADFSGRKKEAEIAIRKHYVAKFLADYVAHEAEVERAKDARRSARLGIEGLQQRATDLGQKIKEHAPAADVINRLIASYLGHHELTIFAVDQGYELHRHGRPISGAPSEGEKTAIAISYFLSSVEAEGRKLKDTIVVIDDPVSSLDTKALNFACTLVRSRLEGACQLFVLTHNQQCLNEFRKAWKRRVDRKSDTQPTATFLFVDVTLPPEQETRCSQLIKMPKLLREYESEYHYLFSQLLAYHEKPDDFADRGYMMPNIMRRVLDVFLAFRCPGSSGNAGKIERICGDYPALDRARLAALERLAQVESHSDNLDDLISFSSMTVEETSDAVKTLLEMIEIVDRDHLVALKKLCR